MEEIIEAPATKRAKRYIWIYITIILVLVTFSAGLIIGRAWQINNQIRDEEGNIDITKVANINRSLNRSDSVDFEQFWDIWDRIKAKYVKENVDDVDLFYGAISGMINSLEDPHSMYFLPKEAEEFNNELSGNLEGIGAEIGVKEKQLIVIAPLPDSPAEKSGLMPGDKIMFIGGTSTYGMSSGYAVRFIRGKADTKVTLTVKRNGFNELIDIDIIRAQIKVPAILYRKVDNKYAYIRVMQFNGKTTSELKKVISQIKKDSIDGIIIDLRSNPGGMLTTAVSMAGVWIEKGEVVVSQKGRVIDKKDLNSEGEAEFKGIKTIVLVNRGSASASEIVAGALQDHKVAVIMGENTYGKGSVQDYKLFSDGSALKLTVAEWFTPNGNNINESGIIPDIEVKVDYFNMKIGEDKMLDDAVALFSSSTYKWPEIDKK